MNFSSRNGTDVEGASHKHVVDLIKKSQGDLRLVVLASIGDEKSKDIRAIEPSNEDSHDYFDQRSLAITIPDYRFLEVNGEKFHVSLLTKRNNEK